MIQKVFIFMVLVAATVTARAQANLIKADSLPPAVAQMVVASENKLFQDTRTPRFVMIDKTQKFIFGVEGYLGANGYYDFTGVSTGGFSVDAFEVPFQASRSDKVGIDFASSRLAFKLLGDSKWGIVEVTFECAFSGQGNTLALRKGYVRLGNFLVGKDWSVTTDLVSSPTTIDPSGPPSRVGYQLPVIRYACNISSQLRAYFSLEFATITGLYNGNIVTLSKSIPDFNTKFLWRPTKSYTTQLATILRYLKSENDAIPDGGFCFGVEMTHQVKLGKSALYAQGVVGRGVSDYLSGTRWHSLNVVHDPIASRFQTPWTYGCTFAYTLNWSTKSYSNVVGSYLRVFNKNATYDHLLNPTTMRNVLYVAGNYLHKLDKYCTLGAEILYGNKTAFNHLQAHGLRTSILLRYDF